ncbi:hypothetical protein [Curtobacterium aetherium]|uniref:Uncharacterized protein n=1 Tax=Curtobacterium aetherium TaxID=2841594 RepID=A0ACD1E894_9MICO|nr:hypothetical protein [Curtobacterium sp. L6-1]QWS34957.1 hypothetical protein KM842_07505 [Curtobacterium sp. L6-1]
MTRRWLGPGLVVGVGAAVSWAASRALVWWVLVEVRRVGPEPLLLDET